MKSVLFIIVIISSVTITNSYSQDVVFGRRSMPQQDYFEVIPKMRASPILQQLLYLLLTPIQTLSTNLAALACSTIDSILSALTTFTNDIVTTLTTFVSTIPVLPVATIQNVLVGVNAVVSNVTAVLSNWSCIGVGALDSLINNLITAAIGTT